VVSGGKNSVPVNWVIVAGLAGSLVLIGIGVWSDLGGPRVLPRLSLLRRFRQAAGRNPAPGYAVLETVFWVFVLATMVDNVQAPRESTTARLVWLLIIGPHEIGHLICMPFGWTLNILGGSLWQILAFLLPALYAFLVRRQISTSLVFWAMTGHSFINLAPYIGDARARSLPLLFGMSKEHHDWWNLLGHYGLLEYDHTLAAAATLIGAGIIVLAAAAGIITAWLLPRTRLGPAPRFEGNFFRAVAHALAEPGDTVAAEGTTPG
jgi:hypothetical protein